MLTTREWYDLATVCDRAAMEQPTILSFSMCATFARTFGFLSSKKDLVVVAVDPDEEMGKRE